MKTEHPDKKSRKCRKRTIKRHIHNVLHQLFGAEIAITVKAITIIQDLAFDLVARIIKIVPSLMELANRRSVCARDVQTGIRLLLRGELCKHAVSEGTKAVNSFWKNNKGSRTSRSRLTFPVPFFDNLLKSSLQMRVLSNTAPYLTAVIEYVIVEVLIVAGKTCKEVKLRRITPRHILRGIRRDTEIYSLFTGTVAGAGYYASYNVEEFINRLNGVRIEPPDEDD